MSFGSLSVSLSRQTHFVKRKGLPCSQVSAQLAAGSLDIVVGRLVADEALFAEQDRAVLLDTLAPIAHPLAVASRRSRTARPSCRSGNLPEKRTLARTRSPPAAQRPLRGSQMPRRHIRPAWQHSSRRRERWWRQHLPPQRCSWPWSRCCRSRSRIRLLLCS